MVVRLCGIVEDGRDGIDIDVGGHLHGIYVASVIVGDFDLRHGRR